MAVGRIEITSRQPFANGESFGEVGPYEQLDGTVYFSVDPVNAFNETVTDLRLAPRSNTGEVHFYSDFRILKPADQGKGNGRLFFDILNRGRGPCLRNFNNAPDLAPDEPLEAGNGFLMRQGYTVAWCGWQHDAPDVPGVLRLYPPEARNADGTRITGKLVVTFVPNEPINEVFVSDRNHRPYPSNNLEDWDSYMTVQDHEDGPETVIPREQWRFARMKDGQVAPDANYVYKESGFEPGKVYQVIYSTTGAPIVGAGLLATRELASFLRHGTEEDGNPCANSLEFAYSFGSSQSGRFLRDLLYYGLNYDEAGRRVFDGLIPHVAGAKHGEFNQRFAQPSSQASRSPNNLFPFSDLEQTDPLTGQTEGVLSRSAAQGPLPKVMYTYTSSEYWGGGGAMVHIDIAGSRDLEVPEEVRVYHFGGAQHPLGTPYLRDSDPANGSKGQQPFNCLDYRPLLRSALVNLDRWVTDGTPAPAGKYPRLDNGTAADPDTVSQALRRIPAVNTPEPYRLFRRMDFGPEAGVAANVPAVMGEPYPLLVPSVDEDGNEQAGIRLPLTTVPLATHTGWNLRHADIGGEGQILSSGGATGGTLAGSTIPFPATRAQREDTGDPRLSIEERYSSREDYLARIRAAAEELVSQGYVLAEDVELLVSQASHHYVELTSRVPEAQAADN